MFTSQMCSVFFFYVYNQFFCSWFLLSCSMVTNEAPLPSLAPCSPLLQTRGGCSPTPTSEIRSREIHWGMGPAPERQEGSRMGCPWGCFWFAQRRANFSTETDRCPLFLYPFLTSLRSATLLLHAVVQRWCLLSQVKTAFVCFWLLPLGWFLGEESDIFSYIF